MRYTVETIKFDSDKRIATLDHIVAVLKVKELNGAWYLTVLVELRP